MVKNQVRELMPFLKAVFLQERVREFHSLFHTCNIVWDFHKAILIAASS